MCSTHYIVLLHTGCTFYLSKIFTSIIVFALCFVGSINITFLIKKKLSYFHVHVEIQKQFHSLSKGFHAATIHIAFHNFSCHCVHLHHAFCKNVADEIFVIPVNSTDVIISRQHIFQDFVEGLTGGVMGSLKSITHFTNGLSTETKSKRYSLTVGGRA